MALEAEVFYLFIGGVVCVSAVELAVGIPYLRKCKIAAIWFAAHVLTMLLGFAFLTRSVFAGRLGLVYGIPSIDNSISIALFGISWAVSVFCVLQTILKISKYR